IPASDAATATMVGLIGSLADNKCALGRRYGEWAVSAPTIESAVAAAAMAQDELGHARSTYPVLAKLGVTREEDTLDSGSPLAVIERELPDWASVIAAHLVVDGILTTFVASPSPSARGRSFRRRGRTDDTRKPGRAGSSARVARIANYCSRGSARCGP